MNQTVPTGKELARRRRLLKVAASIGARPPSAPDPFPASEEMQGEDRTR